MLAYGFAPAAVVAPVGSVGVIVNELIAVFFLKEDFRRWRRLMRQTALDKTCPRHTRQDCPRQDCRRQTNELP